MPQNLLLKNNRNQIFHGLFASGLTLGFSSRHCGNMSLRYGNTRDARGNRKNFLESLGIDYQTLVCAKQIHNCQVKLVTKDDAGRGALSYDTAIPDTDSLITSEKNLPLAVFTADCLSVFLYDPQKNCIGLAHAGWRSTKENILSETLEVMKNEFNTLAENVCAGFGPAIRSCCYEVGEDFRDIFPSGLIEKNGRLYLDLVKINKKQLLDCGVKDTNIFDLNLCTSCHSADLFSYRKEGPSCGRMMSVIMLK
jgi:hypothetical protein